MLCVRCGWPLYKSSYSCSCPQLHCAPPARTCHVHAPVVRQQAAIQSTPLKPHPLQVRTPHSPHHLTTLLFLRLDAALFAPSQAISSAAASGPNGQQATADAAASVYCDKTQGSLSPSAAAAWGVSYAIAISQDPKTGCITLSKAFSSANAFCGPSGAKAITQDSAIVQQLGKCVSVPGFQIPSFALSGGTSGVVNTPGAGGSASAGGSANAPGGSSALRGCASNDVNCLLAQFGNARG